MLVTGANGFVGYAFCTEASRRGYRIRTASRDPSEIDFSNGDAIRIQNIDSTTDWTEALSGISTVIHLAARVHVMHDHAKDPIEAFRRVNVAGTERLALSAAASGVKRMVYVSSIKVNGEVTFGGDKFTESDVPSPQDPYGVSKCEAELSLRHIAEETGLEVVIVRLPLVYGPGVKGNFVQMLKVLSKGIPLPFSSIRNLRSLIYVSNLVDALMLCATHPAAAGQIYLVSDAEDISTSQLLNQLGMAMGRPARLFPCPPALLKLAGRLAGRSDQIERLLGSLQVDSDKICRELNWTPPYRLQQGLQATAEWYRDAYL